MPRSEQEFRSLAKRLGFDDDALYASGIQPEEADAFRTQAKKTFQQLRQFGMTREDIPEGKQLANLDYDSFLAETMNGIKSDPKQQRYLGLIEELRQQNYRAQAEAEGIEAKDVRARQSGLQNTFGDVLNASRQFANTASFGASDALSRLVSGAVGDKKDAFDRGTQALESNAQQAVGGRVLGAAGHIAGFMTPASAFAKAGQALMGGGRAARVAGTLLGGAGPKANLVTRMLSNAGNFVASDAAIQLGDGMFESMHAGNWQPLAQHWDETKRHAANNAMTGALMPFFSRLGNATTARILGAQGSPQRARLLGESISGAATMADKARLLNARTWGGAAEFMPFMALPDFSGHGSAVPMKQLVQDLIAGGSRRSEALMAILEQGLVGAVVKNLHGADTPVGVPMNPADAQNLQLRETLKALDQGERNNAAAGILPNDPNAGREAEIPEIAQIREALAEQLKATSEAEKDLLSEDVLKVLAFRDVLDANEAQARGEAVNVGEYGFVSPLIQAELQQAPREVASPRARTAQSREEIGRIDQEINKRIQDSFDDASTTRDQSAAEISELVSQRNKHMKDVAADAEVPAGIAEKPLRPGEKPEVSDGSAATADPYAFPDSFVQGGVGQRVQVQVGSQEVPNAKGKNKKAPQFQRGEVVKVEQVPTGETDPDGNPVFISRALVAVDDPRSSRRLVYELTPSDFIDGRAEFEKAEYTPSGEQRRLFDTGEQPPMPEQKTERQTEMDLQKPDKPLMEMADAEPDRRSLLSGEQKRLFDTGEKDAAVPEKSAKQTEMDLRKPEKPSVEMEEVQPDRRPMLPDSGEQRRLFDTGEANDARTPKETQVEAALAESPNAKTDDPTPDRSFVVEGDQRRMFETGEKADARPGETQKDLPFPMPPKKNIRKKGDSPGGSAPEAGPQGGGSSGGPGRPPAAPSGQPQAAEKTTDAVIRLFDEIREKDPDLADRTQKAVEALQQENRRLNDAVNIDPRTGLASKAAWAGLGKRLDSENARGYSVIAIDVGDFKQVNDKFGHLAGDQVLAAVGAEVKKEAGRLGASTGGDEFSAVAMHDNDAIRISNALNGKKISVEVDTADGKKATAEVTLDLGVARQSGDQKFSDVFSAADLKMYENKGARKAKRAPAAEAVAAPTPAATPTPGSGVLAFSFKDLRDLIKSEGLGIRRFQDEPRPEFAQRVADALAAKEKGATPGLSSGEAKEAVRPSATEAPVAEAANTLGDLFTKEELLKAGANDAYGRTYGGRALEDFYTVEGGRRIYKANQLGSDSSPEQAQRVVEALEQTLAAKASGSMSELRQEARDRKIINEAIVETEKALDLGIPAVVDADSAAANAIVQESINPAKRLTNDREALESASRSSTTLAKQHLEALESMRERVQQNLNAETSGQKWLKTKERLDEIDKRISFARSLMAMAESAKRIEGKEGESHPLPEVGDTYHVITTRNGDTRVVYGLVVGSTAEDGGKRIKVYTGTHDGKPVYESVRASDIVDAGPATLADVDLVNGTEMSLKRFQSLQGEIDGEEMSQRRHAGLGTKKEGGANLGLLIENKTEGYVLDEKPADPMAAAERETRARRQRFMNQKQIPEDYMMEALALLAPSDARQTLELSIENPKERQTGSRRSGRSDSVMRDFESVLLPFNYFKPGAELRDPASLGSAERERYNAFMTKYELARQHRDDIGKQQNIASSQMIYPVMQKPDGSGIWAIRLKNVHRGEWRDAIPVMVEPTGGDTVRVKAISADDGAKWAKENGFSGDWDNYLAKTQAEYRKLRNDRKIATENAALQVEIGNSLRALEADLMDVLNGKKPQYDTPYHKELRDWIAENPMPTTAEQLKGWRRDARAFLFERPMNATISMMQRTVKGKSDLNKASASGGVLSLEHRESQNQGAGNIADESAMPDAAYRKQSQTGPLVRAAERAMNMNEDPLSGGIFRRDADGNWRVDGAAPGSKGVVLGSLFGGIHGIDKKEAQRLMGAAVGVPRAVLRGMTDFADSLIGDPLRTIGRSWRKSENPIVQFLDRNLNDNIDIFSDYSRPLQERDGEITDSAIKTHMNLSDFAKMKREDQLRLLLDAHDNGKIDPTLKWFHAETRRNIEEAVELGILPPETMERFYKKNRFYMHFGRWVWTADKVAERLKQETDKLKKHEAERAALDSTPAIQRGDNWRKTYATLTGRIQGANRIIASINAKTGKFTLMPKRVFQFEDPFTVDSSDVDAMFARGFRRHKGHDKMAEAIEDGLNVTDPIALLYDTIRSQRNAIAHARMLKKIVGNKNLVQNASEAPTGWIRIESAGHNQNEFWQPLVGKAIEPHTYDALNVHDPSRSRWSALLTAAHGAVKASLTAVDPGSMLISQGLGNINTMISAGIPVWDVPFDYATGFRALNGKGPQGANYEKFLKMGWIGHRTDVDRDMDAMLDSSKIITKDGTAHESPYFGLVGMEVWKQAANDLVSGKNTIRGLGGVTKGLTQMYGQFDAAARIGMYHHLTTKQGMSEAEAIKKVDMFYDMAHIPRGFQMARRSGLHSFASYPAVMKRNMSRLVATAPITFAQMALWSSALWSAVQMLTGKSDDEIEKIREDSIPEGSEIENLMNRHLSTPTLTPGGVGVIPFSRTSAINASLRSFPGAESAVQNLVSRQLLDDPGAGLAATRDDFWRELSSNNVMLGSSINYWSNPEERENLEKPGLLGSTGYMRSLLERSPLIAGALSLVPGLREAAPLVTKGLRTARQFAEVGEGALGVSPKTYIDTSGEKPTARRKTTEDAISEFFGINNKPPNEFRRAIEHLERVNRDVLSETGPARPRRWMDRDSKEREQADTAVSDLTVLRDIEQGVKATLLLKIYEKSGDEEREDLRKEIQSILTGADSYKRLVRNIARAGYYGVVDDLGRLISRHPDILPDPKPRAEPVDEKRVRTLLER